VLPGVEAPRGTASPPSSHAARTLAPPFAVFGRGPPPATGRLRTENCYVRSRATEGVLFLTHLAAAVLLARWSRLTPGWAVVGAAAPDVVDKPLAMVGVTELFHSAGHSLLLAILVVPVMRSGRTGLAAGAGWLSHLLLDALHVVVNGRPADALFLLWPAVVPPNPLAIPPGSFFWYYLWSPSFYLEGIVWGALAVIVLRHGPRALASDAD